VRNITGAYELDPVSAELLGARWLRLIQRDGRVTGRCGRYGNVHGYARDRRLEATCRRTERTGSLELTFGLDFGSFEGTYRLEDRAFPIRGRRHVRTAKREP
jgi:hypothetical protein